MSKYSQGRSTRCTCSRVRHSAGSIEDVCPRRNKDIKLWVQNSWLIAPSLPSGRLTRKLDKICSNFFKSIFGKNDFFSKKHCFIQSRCISKLFLPYKMFGLQPLWIFKTALHTGGSFLGKYLQKLDVHKLFNR